MAVSLTYILKRRKTTLKKLCTMYKLSTLDQVKEYLEKNDIQLPHDGILQEAIPVLPKALATHKVVAANSSPQSAKKKKVRKPRKTTSPPKAAPSRIEESSASIEIISSSVSVLSAEPRVEDVVIDDVSEEVAAIAKAESTKSTSISRRKRVTKRKNG